MSKYIGTQSSSVMPVFAMSFHSLDLLFQIIVLLFHLNDFFKFIFQIFLLTLAFYFFSLAVCEWC